MIIGTKIILLIFTTVFYLYAVKFIWKNDVDIRVWANNMYSDFVENQSNVDVLSKKTLQKIRKKLLNSLHKDKMKLDKGLALMKGEEEIDQDSVENLKLSMSNASNDPMNLYRNHLSASGDSKFNSTEEDGMLGEWHACVFRFNKAVGSVKQQQKYYIESDEGRIINAYKEVIKLFE